MQSACALSAPPVAAVPARPEAAKSRVVKARFLAETAASLNEIGLPGALVKWGHPGNMGVVLSAMGGTGAAAGWQIRLGTDADAVEAARKSHAPLMIGMTTFFALGAVGGLLSLTMQGQPVFSSGHVWTGLGGIALLATNGMLSAFFDDDANARTAHAFLGSATMALFVIHAALGLQLGLSLPSI
jgi:hypothetical protein